MLHKKYVEHNGQTIKFSVSFNRDRTNWATGEAKRIGYQVSATPVKVTIRDGFRMEEFGAFTGFCDCLLEVDRQSSKRLATAIKLLEAKMPDYLKWFDQRATA